jgi:membrane protein DedA with SNARE-associated domain
MITLLLSICAALPSWLRDISVLGVHISISNFLNTFGYVAVFFFIGIESTGIPFPGETMLVAASVYAAQSCGLHEPAVIVACILGATTGDNLGFWVGRTGGRELIRKYGRYVHVNERHLAHAERYFDRFGGATVFFGRFLAILRAWAAFLAGVNGMRPLRFFLYNFFGAVLWSTTFGTLGFVLGKNLPKLQQILTALGTGGAIAVTLLVVVAIGVIWYRSRQASLHAREKERQRVAPDAANSVNRPSQLPTEGA